MDHEPPISDIERATRRVGHGLLGGVPLSQIEDDLIKSGRFNATEIIQIINEATRRVNTYQRGVESEFSNHLIYLGVGMAVLLLIVFSLAGAPESGRGQGILITGFAVGGFALVRGIWGSLKN